MYARLPPLNALKAFEAAGRHLSVKKAAAELNVTPAAVSHQIKALEDALGVKLFIRRNRALELTEAARACLPKLREGFDSLAQAVSTLIRIWMQPLCGIGRILEGPDTESADPWVGKSFSQALAHQNGSSGPGARAERSGFCPA